MEIPYVFVESAIYTLIVYSMMSFQWTPAKFFWFFYVSFLTFLYFTYYGMMSIAISPNIQVASIFTASFYPLFNLFSGFFIPRKVSHWFLLSSRFQTIMLCYICKLTQIMSFSENPGVVGLVLLDLSCHMDGLRADCVTVWWCGRFYQGAWTTRSTSKVFHQGSLWLWSGLHGCRGSSSSGLYCVLRVHICLLHKDL